MKTEWCWWPHKRVEIGVLLKRWTLLCIGCEDWDYGRWTAIEVGVLCIWIKVKVWRETQRRYYREGGQ